MRSELVAFLVFKKEIKESLRDVKTLLITYGIPVIIYPLLAIWGGEMAAVQMERTRTEELPVLLLGKVSPEIRGKIGSEKRLSVKSLSREKLDAARLLLSALDTAPGGPLTAPRDEARSKIRDFLRAEGLAVILTCSDYRETMRGLQNHRCTIIYDATAQASSRAQERVAAQLVELSGLMRGQRMRFLKLSDASVNPFRVEEQDTAGITRVIGQGLGLIVPALLFVILCISSYYPALNSTVGEKERGTFSTLMSIPLKPRDLVLGKFASVVFFCLAGIATYMVTLALTTLFVIKGVRLQGTVNPLYLVPLTVLPAAMLVSAVSLCVGLFARKMSEGQACLSLLMILLLFPMLLIANADIHLTAFTAAIPIVNVALIAKNFAVDPMSLSWVVLAAASNLALAGALLAFSSSLVESEYKAETGLSDLLTMDRKLMSNPTPALSFALFFLMATLAFYINLALAAAPMLLTVLFTHIGVLSALPWGAVRYFRMNFREVFAWTPPRISSVTGAALVAFCAPIAVLFIFPSIPLPKEVGEEVAKKLFSEDGILGTFIALLTAAILPGLCEELAFRGAVLSGLLRGFSKTWAVIISAAMFAVIHFSALRLAPTFAMGLILGFTVVSTRSIFVGMAIHVGYNSLLILAMRYPDVLQHTQLRENTIPTTPGTVAICGVLLGLGVIHLSMKDVNGPVATQHEEPSLAA